MTRPALLLALLLALLAPGPARAGAWPRETGRVFMATTSALDTADGWRVSGTEFHVEYGLRPRLTLGFAAELRDRLTYVESFARWHPPDLAGGLHWGLSAGLRHYPGHWSPLRGFLGVELGRGFDTRAGNLWVQAGARQYLTRNFLGTFAATEWSAQIGLSRGRWMGIFGVTRFDAPSYTADRLRPALGVRIGRFQLVGEAVIVPGGRTESLRLGLWQEF